MNIIGGTTAGSQYAAIAFGTVDQMQDADLYYCTDSEMSTGVIRALRKQPEDEARPVSTMSSVAKRHLYNDVIIPISAGD